MAVYDLEEQEQIDEIKAWWKQYGNLVILLATAAVLTVAGMRGWSYYQTRQGVEAGELYTQLQGAAGANDPKKVQDIAAVITDRYKRTGYAAFAALAPAAQRAIDPDSTLAVIRDKVLSYVENELIAREMNVFDAALALIALGHLGADPSSFTPALHCIVSRLGEGGRRGPFRAYEWNKMKTPTRILVGGPEVTSAFALMGLTLARRALMRRAN